jgi:limonene-1,2-epoxide hydrolase
MEPEQVVRDHLAAWSRLDVDELMSYFTADAVWDNVPIGPVSGQDGIRELIASFLKFTTSADMEILNLAVAGNVVMTERVDHLGLGPETMHARVMGVFEITDGKIAAWRDYFHLSAEEAAAMEALMAEG